jgi:putative SOS response-associated peptidase YedK
MCGRFTLIVDGERLAALWGWTTRLPIHPRFNIAPTQDILAVRLVDGVPAPVMLRWGLVPHWAKDPSVGTKMINARAETLLERPSFREAFQRRRCLIVADGFYEWQQAPGKQPFRIHPADGGMLTFAGLWERWTGTSGETVESCTIVTTTANAALAGIHHRMPVIIAERDRARWLDVSVPVGEVADLLRPAPDDLLATTPVSRHVNSAANEGPECLAGADAGPLQLDLAVPEPPTAR